MRLEPGAGDDAREAGGDGGSVGANGVTKSPIPCNEKGKISLQPLQRKVNRPRGTVAAAVSTIYCNVSQIFLRGMKPGYIPLPRVGALRSGGRVRHGGKKQSEGSLEGR